MRKAQARRLALWLNGVYLFSADHSGLSDAAIGDDEAKVMDAQRAIGIDMIQRSGIPADAEEAEAVRMVLADERVTKGE